MGADFGDEFGDWLLRKSSEWTTRYGYSFGRWLYNRSRNPGIGNESRAEKIFEDNSDIAHDITYKEVLQNEVEIKTDTGIEKPGISVMRAKTNENAIAVVQALQNCGLNDCGCYEKTILVDSQEFDHFCSESANISRAVGEYNKIKNNPQCMSELVAKQKNIEKDILKVDQKPTKENITRNLKETIEHKPDHIKAPKKDFEIGQNITK